MSLRDRLTFLNVILVGEFFVFFSILTYVTVSFLLYQQIDNSLEATATQIVSQADVTVSGQMEEIITPDLSLTSNVYIQVWSGDTMVDSYPHYDLKDSIDPVGFRSTQPMYRNVTFGEFRFRVLSIPLTLEGRVIGVVQVAANMNVVETTRDNLVGVLILATVLGIGFTAAASRGMVDQLIAPLDAITTAADQINRADDLSRRVPYNGAPEDEVGQLVHAFNQNLERLEVLFTSQQRFLADVSHELRTPLTVIKGNVDLMRRMKEFDPEMLDSIEQESSRLTRLVLDLLLLAKAEAGQLPLNKTGVEFDSLVMEVFNEMRILAGGRVHLKLMEIDQLQVHGDRDRLKQVLINLIANAIKFTPSDGDVYLSLSRSNDFAKMIVRDTGPGIPADDIPYIFERFYRVEKSRTRSAMSGFGLGLSIAHWIVEQHGGKIEVNSQEGKGTTFAVWIPLVK